MITVKELIEELEDVNGNTEVRIVSQYDKETGTRYHNEIEDVYMSNEDGENVIVLESAEI